jgi:hypothetical protein
MFHRLGRRAIGYLAEDLDDWAERGRRSSTSETSAPLGGTCIERVAARRVDAAVDDAAKRRAKGDRQ